VRARACHGTPLTPRHRRNTPAGRSAALGRNAQLLLPPADVAPEIARPGLQPGTTAPSATWASAERDQASTDRCLPAAVSPLGEDVWRLRGPKVARQARERVLRAGPGKASDSAGLGVPRVQGRPGLPAEEAATKSLCIRPTPNPLRCGHAGAACALPAGRPRCAAPRSARASPRGSGGGSGGSGTRVAWTRRPARL